MSAEETARRHYRRRRRLADALAATAARLWSRVDPDDIAQSWVAQLPELLTATVGAQVAASATADAYLNAVLAEQGISATAEGQVQARSLAGVASDGRNLASLLFRPVVTTLAGIVGNGRRVDEALAGGLATLDMIARTQVADAGRSADQMATVARPRATGYVRMVVGRTCSRCVILAGRWYAVNAGFPRHPRCDCIHVPGREDTTSDIRTDPKAYFRSLSPAEQDKAFTKAGAQAIRDGASITQVVNARRGAFGLTPAGARITAAEARSLRNGLERGRLQTRQMFGRDLYVTTEGVTTRGLAGVRLGAKRDGVKAGGRYRRAKAERLMPESIYQIAGGDRAEAVRLLKRYGYIT